MKQMKPPSLSKLFLLLAMILVLACCVFGELEVVPSLFNANSETAAIIYETHEETDVTIGVFNSNDDLVRRIFENIVSSGTHQITWDGRDDYGNILPDDTYYIKAFTNQQRNDAITFGSICHFGNDTAFNAGKIAVANLLGHQVEIFNTNGELLGRFGVFGTETGQLAYPFGVAIDDLGQNYYVSDLSGRIQKIDINGNFTPVDNGLLYPRGLDYFNNSLYASTNLRIYKYGNSDSLLYTSPAIGNIPDITVADNGLNTNVYFIETSTPPGPAIYKIEDTGSSLTNLTKVCDLNNPETGIEWNSISYDHSHNYIYSMYINEDKKKFGIWVVEESTGNIIDQFEILEISTTGKSIAVQDTLNDKNFLWVAGLNILNRFEHSPVSSPGSLDIVNVIGNSSIIYLWLNDLEYSPADYILSPDRGFFPEAKEPNFLTIPDLEKIEVYNGISTFSFGEYGITNGKILEPRGIASLEHIQDSTVYNYVLNRSSTAYPNAGALYRYDNDFNFMSTYYTLNEPIGLDSFYSWLFTLQKQTGIDDYEIVVIDTHVDSVGTTPPTVYTYAPSGSEPVLTNPVNIAVDYYLFLYVLTGEDIYQYIVDVNNQQIYYIQEFETADIVEREYTAIAIDLFGKVYVYNDAIGRIQIFNRQGEFVKLIGKGKGWKKNYFNRVEGMDFDPDGRLWVADSGNHRFKSITFTYEKTESVSVTLTPNSGIPYVSVFSISRDEPVIAGELEVTIQFSEEMDISREPEVALVDGEFGNIHTINMKSYSGNTWKGTINIKPGTGNGTGQVHIRNAYDLDGHKIENTTRSLEINTKVPKLISNLTNYPNPFSPVNQTTRIEYYLNQNSFVTIDIFDLSGRRVIEKKFSPGQIGGQEGAENYFNWDGKSESGIIVQNGIYILRITAKGLESGEKEILKRKIAILK